MRKTAYLIIALLVSFTNINAQNQDNKKETPKEEFIIPGNRTAVNEALEEIKVKIVDAEKKVTAFKSYGKSLENFKSRISGFEPNSVDQIFKDIETGISTKSNEDIYIQEEALLDKLTIFNLGFSFRYIDIIDEISSISTLTKDIADITKPIMENELLRLLLNNHDNDNNKTIISDKAKLDKVKGIINTKVLSEIKTKILAKVDLEIGINKTNLENAEADVKVAKSNKTKLLNKLNEQETQINDLAIKLGLPLFCLTILLLFLGPKIIKLFIKSESIEATDETSQNVLLEISTVLLLTMSILILGLSSKIQSDVLGTLIGGISGYVLNRIRSGNK